MPKFMKGLAVVLLILMLIGSIILAGAIDRYEYDIAVLSYGLLISFIVFGVLYSIGYALQRLDDIRSIVARGFGIELDEKTTPSQSAAEETPKTTPTPQKQDKVMNPWASGK